MKDEGLVIQLRFPSSFRLHPSSLPSERSHSGLVHRSRKPEWVNAHRGFESHPLRHRVRTACGSGRLTVLINALDKLSINRPLPQTVLTFLSRRGARVVELAALEML